MKKPSHAEMTLKYFNECDDPAEKELAAINALRAFGEECYPEELLPWLYQACEALETEKGMRVKKVKTDITRESQVQEVRARVNAGETVDHACQSVADTFKVEMETIKRYYNSSEHREARNEVDNSFTSEKNRN